MGLAEPKPSPFGVPNITPSVAIRHRTPFLEPLALSVVDKPPLRTYYFPIMASERIQRRIDGLLDQIEQAVDQLNYERVRRKLEKALPD